MIDITREGESHRLEIYYLSHSSWDRLTWSVEIWVAHICLTVTVALNLIVMLLITLNYFFVQLSNQNFMINKWSITLLFNERLATWKQN